MPPAERKAAKKEFELYKADNPGSVQRHVAAKPVDQVSRGLANHKKYIPTRAPAVIDRNDGLFILNFPLVCVTLAWRDLLDQCDLPGTHGISGTQDTEIHTGTQICGIKM